jgi:hypothetical protein
MASPRRPMGFGVPEPQRSNRFVVTLIAYSDESEQDQVLVYAGFIARVWGWMSPLISYLMTRHEENLKFLMRGIPSENTRHAPNIGLEDRLNFKTT